MINHVYQLISPKTIVVKFEDSLTEGKVVVRPRYMGLCHADARYYWGRRDPKALRKKLPMALIHECVGEVLADQTETFDVGDQVVLIPNVPGESSEEIYENYAKGSRFLSSGVDGFMREIVALPPDRVVEANGVDPVLAAITEFVSVAVHAVGRFDKVAHSCRKRIAVIGDGSLGFSVACVLSVLMPDSELVIVGHNSDKLSLFSFAQERYLSDEVPEALAFDHAFECTGGDGCESAIDFVIEHVNPQGTLILMGVDERPVPVLTRNVLEKGMTLVGCSRSGRKDFEKAVELLRIPAMQKRFRQIVCEDAPVSNVKDIKRVFATDLQTPFKTVFEWDM